MKPQNALILFTLTSIFQTDLQAQSATEQSPSAPPANSSPTTGKPPTYSDGKNEFGQVPGGLFKVQYKTPKSTLQVDTALTGTGTAIIAQAIMRGKAHFKQNTSNAVLNLVTGAISIIGGISYVAKAADFPETDADPVRQLRLTPFYAELVEQLGKDKAENMISDIAADWDFEHLVSKYAKSEEDRQSLLKMAATEKKDMTELFSPVEDSKQKDAVIEQLVMERVLSRSVIQNISSEETKAELTAMLDKQRADIKSQMTSIKLKMSTAGVADASAKQSSDATAEKPVADLLTPKK